MSSSFHVACLGHTPALNIEYASWNSAPDALEAVTNRNDGLQGHPDCDLVVVRHSGAPVEIGCPPNLWHPTSTHWVDMDWLRLLAWSSSQSSTPRLDAIRARFARCWGDDRLSKLEPLLFDGWS